MIPRTLFLTPFAPDKSYAGGENIRKIVQQLPQDQIRWASLEACRGSLPVSAVHAAFQPASLHWRLCNTAMNSLYTDEWQSRELANRIAAWVKPFAPELLWVVPELGCIRLASLLARRLKLPIHATLHDAVETARFILPRCYYPVYAWRMRQLLNQVTSVDAISNALLSHVGKHCPAVRAGASIVVPPPIAKSLMVSGKAARFGRRDSRRIAFCGSMRTTPAQWFGFLNELSALHRDVELVIYAYKAMFPVVELPSRVRLRFESFLPEAELIRALQDADIDACYLGLWKEPERRLFAQTSVSAKLTTYAAAGLPVIVDGPEDSAAWILVGKYEAGVLVPPSRNTPSMAQLFSDEELWRKMAEGAHRMCWEEFDLDRNVVALSQRLTATATPHPNPPRIAVTYRRRRLSLLLRQGYGGQEGERE